jgi:hypothetical protein
LLDLYNSRIPVELWLKKYEYRAKEKWNNINLYLIVWYDIINR